MMPSQAAIPAAQQQQLRQDKSNTVSYCKEINRTPKA
jgi:hypothetical protein